MKKKVYLAVFFTDRLNQTDKFEVNASKEKAINIVLPGLKAIIELGKKNKVDKLLKIKLTKIDETYFINVQLFDVKKGKNIYSTTRNTKSPLEFEELTQKIISNMLGEEEQPSTKVLKETPINNSYQNIKNEKDEITYIIGISSGIYFPLDNKNAKFLKNDFPYFGITFGIQNIMMQGLLFEVDAGYFSSKSKDDKDDIKITSLPIVFLAGYNIKLIEKLFMVPKIGAGYWFQKGSERFDGKTPDINYPITQLELEIKYNINENLFASLGYRFNVLFGSNEMYYYHAPLMLVSYKY